MVSLMNRPYLNRRVDYPYVNIYEDNDDIEVSVVAPGIKVEDINLQLVDNRLTVEAEKKTDYTDKNYIRKERDFGSFKKVVELPYRVNPSKIEAAIKDGILTVKLTRAEETKPRKIEIH